MHRLVALVMSLLSGLGLSARQRALWQADVMIRSLTVTEEKGNLTARVVVAVEVGEALGARVEVLLSGGVSRSASPWSSTRSRRQSAR
jgi:hypothetical protein